MNKRDEIKKYSNPKIVYKKAINLYGDNVLIRLSTKKNKKYMIYDKLNDRWVHFGEMGYVDYTKSNDDYKRELFKIRNYKWKNAPFNTPSYMAYYLLW